MRIRMWRAFASNNSGSYTLVGRFETPEAARAVVALLAPALAAHDAWARSDDRAGAAPLQGLISEHGLRPDPRAGVSDDWPLYGEAPEIVAIDQQVMIHVGYTATMPPLFGELFYRRGGRVSAELDHTHEALLTRFELWDPGTPVGSSAGLQAAESALGGRPAPPRDHTGSQVPPVLSQTHSGWVLEYATAPQDPIAEARAIAALAAAHGVRVRLRLEEGSDRADPLIHLRPPE